MPLWTLCDIIWQKFTDVSEECALSIIEVQDGGSMFLRKVGEVLLHGVTTNQALIAIAVRTSNLHFVLSADAD
jgi:hypothetical protein